VNEQLDRYLSSSDHRSWVATYGITQREIDIMLSGKSAA
jgi:hypothetical protein